MAGFHTQVKLVSFPFEDGQLTVNLAAAITAADIGKAVTQDVSAPNTVKLAGDGDEIVGSLLTFEDRTVEGQKLGTVEFRFARKLTKTAAAVAVGDRLIGAGNGLVKKAVGTEAFFASAPRVWQVDGNTVHATKFF